MNKSNNKQKSIAITLFKIHQTKTRGDKYKIVPNLCTIIVRYNAFFVRVSRIYAKLPSETRYCDLKEFVRKLNTETCLNMYLKCKF